MLITDLTAEAFRPYGWLLGKGRPLHGLDFWQELVFDPGVGGETEVLWVKYRDRSPEVPVMEVHRLTQQALVPLTGPVIQVVARSQSDGALDTSSIAAFSIPVGLGICMRPGCWHATRLAQGTEVTCFMLTRRSTTVDLADHLQTGSALRESAISKVDLR